MLVDLPSQATAKGAEVTIVLVHGVSLSAHCYAPLAATLSARSYNVGIQLPGHGGAPEPEPGSDPWTAFAEAVEHNVAELRRRVDSPIVVCGHSGGATSVLMAEQRRPLPVQAMFLYEPALRPPAPPSQRAQWLIEKTLRRPAHFENHAAAVEHARTSSPTRKFDSRAIEGFVTDGFVPAHRGVRLACRPEFEAEIYRHAADNSCWQQLAGVQARVRIAYGTGSPAGALNEVAPEIARRLPHADAVTIEGAGHFGPCEVVESVAASIDSFVEQCLTLASAHPLKNKEQ